MRTIFSFIVIFHIFLCAGCSPTATAPAKQTNAPTADPLDSQEVVDVGENEAAEFVIDVRSKEEWDTGHVEKAVLIPHEEISSRIGEVTEDKSAKIVLYCKSGGRAGRAKTALEELGYTNIENAGGYVDVKDRFAE